MSLDQEALKWLESLPLSVLQLVFDWFVSCRDKAATLSCGAEPAISIALRLALLPACPFCSLPLSVLLCFFTLCLRLAFLSDGFSLLCPFYVCMCVSKCVKLSAQKPICCYIMLLCHKEVIKHVFTPIHCYGCLGIWVMNVENQNVNKQTNHMKGFAIDIQ